jgi:hypothetical protein
MLAGLIGAIAGTAMPSGRTEAVEAGPNPAQPPVKPVPRLNQAPVKLNPAPVQVNQRGSLAPNRGPAPLTRGVQDDDDVRMNQGRRPFNQQDPRWNQMRAWVNQRHQPRMNQQAHHFNQGGPGFNQREWQGWNQGHHRFTFNQGAWPGWNQSHRH